MDTTSDLARAWIDEAKKIGFHQPNAAGHFLWNWPIEVSDDGQEFFGQGRSISETGVEFSCQNELPIAAKVRLRRQLNSESNAWVSVQVKQSRKEGATFVVDAIFDA